jgi:uncharacterized membrane protein
VAVAERVLLEKIRNILLEVIKLVATAVAALIFLALGQVQHQLVEAVITLAVVEVAERILLVEELAVTP